MRAAALAPAPSRGRALALTCFVRAVLRQSARKHAVSDNQRELPKTCAGQVAIPVTRSHVVFAKVVVRSEFVVRLSFTRHEWPRQAEPMAQRRKVRASPRRRLQRWPPSRPPGVANIANTEAWGEW